MPEFLDDCVYKILQEKPKLVEFSSIYEQNCASIALAKAIKEVDDIPIIFGGANCEGEMGSTLLKYAPWIDFVCSGEGEIAFIEFLKSFLRGNSHHKVNGIITRDSSVFDIALTNPIMDMDSLPIPDFDDYFTELANSLLRDDLYATLVVETSRGCWWGVPINAPRLIPIALDFRAFLRVQGTLNNYMTL